MNATPANEQIQTLLTSGQRQLQADDYLAAVKSFEAILALDPQHCEALNMAAIAAWQAGDLTTTLNHLDQAMAFHPGHPKAYLNLGVILEHYGRLDEAANAYRASLEASPEQVLAHFNLGNVLAKMGNGTGAVAAYNQVLARQSEHIDALNNKGLTLKDMGRLGEAEAVLRDAVRVNPKSDQSWANLGLLLRFQHRPDDALEAYEKALVLNPSSIKTLNNVAVLHRWEGRLDEAEAICRGILQNSPDVIETLNNLGDILQAQGRVEEARAAFERVLEIDPNHPEGHHNLAVLLLLCGEFKAGWAHYEWRWLAKEFPSERRNFPQPLWTGEALAGKRILLYVEQGLGDAIQFVRYAPLVQRRGGHVIVECPNSLKRLFQSVDGVHDVHDVIARGDALPDFDVQCPFLSLPSLLSPTADDIPTKIPYLFPPQQTQQKWCPLLSDIKDFKVGLVWAGSPHHTNDRERSIPLEQLAVLAKVPGCTFINLQIGDSAKQLADVDWPIMDMTQHVEDYADTAALVSELDLVITVDTSVAHVAGALGKPVWVMLPHAPDWRWLREREDSPWYPSMKLFRQSKRRDWPGVVARVYAALMEEAKQH
ncbi:MAG: tetratricopeptide repeat protein [Rhodospirillales bacterium]|nr:tetratricopeptide repeat protein [Rhodospirillales bacterium]